MNALYATVTNLLSAPGNALAAFTKPMDAILSLPLVSLFLVPGMTSWATSFNLLFFYFTWSTLLISHPPLRVEFVGTLIVRTVFYILPCTLFLAFDTLIPSLAKNVKEHGSQGIATDTVNGGIGKNGKLWKVLLYSLFNLVAGIGLQTGVDWFFVDVLRTSSLLKITTTLPMPWGICKNLAAGFLLREVLGYVTHRWVLHDKSTHATRWLGAKHRVVYHHLKAPLPFSAHVDHLLPYLIRVWLPTYLPAALLRFHLLTYHMYLALISLEEALVYSNYKSLPSGLILGGMARRAERHLRAKGNLGNFSPYGLADLVMGTGVAEEDDEEGILGDMRDEAERRDLPEKAKTKGRQIRQRADRVERELRQLRSDSNGRDPGSEAEPGAKRRTRTPARSRS